MPRRSPRSRRRAPKASKLPQKPRVRSAPGRARSTAARPKHVAAGARGTAPVRKKGGRAVGTRQKASRVAKRATRRFAAPDPVRVRALLEQLRELYPDARCALDFDTPLQLLVATILSAQCTDERVNKVTPVLFTSYPDAAALAQADPTALEKAIHSTGFFRNKARSIREAAADIVARHAG